LITRELFNLISEGETMSVQLPYIFICDKNLNKLHIVNINKKQDLSLVIQDVLYFGAIGIQSNYKNPLDAKFKRTKDTRNEATSRLIVKDDLPKRFNTDELVAFLQSLQKRGKDKKKRVLNPKSLLNLRPAKRFSKDYHFTKKSLLNESQLSYVEQLREKNIPYREISEELGLPVEKVRNAYSYFRNKQKETNSALLN
jgi:hypothetical protein